MDGVDLHTHSTASDGTVPPAEVVRRAASLGLAGVSLTDHDTVDGLEEAAAEADRLGLRFLVGAELSANEPDRSVHVLAYGFDPGDPGLTEFFRTYREDRERRAREIVRRFNELDVPLEYRAVEEETAGGVPTRAHVARALVREGLVPDERTVFRRYLARGGPAFVEKRPTPPAEVFEKVHRGGGVAVLAHPGWSHEPEDIRRWIGDGLDGVEVRHPRNHPKVRERLTSMATEHDLLVTGGSDWHGPDAERAPLGAEDVPMAWMEAVAERAEDRRGAVEAG
jgi:predicted metal-dependent phosphoesterase TrpH